MGESTMADVASRYAESLNDSARRAAVGQVNDFVKWYGPDKYPAQIRGHDIELYAESLGPAVPETQKKADQVRAFLTYMKKSGIVESSLAPHLRLKKSTK